MLMNLYRQQEEQKEQPASVSACSRLTVSDGQTSRQDWVADQARVLFSCFNKSSLTAGNEE